MRASCAEGDVKTASLADDLMNYFSVTASYCFHSKSKATLAHQRERALISGLGGGLHISRRGANLIIYGATCH